MTDLGYFGPGSMTWRIQSEPVAMVGGLRALLLQALHPDAMRLLAERSNFRADPWARFESTATYVGVVSFAPRAEVDAAAARVRTVHRALGIDDQEQLAWVHACLVGLVPRRRARRRVCGSRRTSRTSTCASRCSPATLVGV